MTRAEWEALVEYTLNIGRQMMECGAEAWRAENTMARIFRAYGLEVLDAHVIATQAAVTVKTPTGEHYTSTCMILPDKTGTDLGRLETLNAAARHICDAPPPLEELPLCLKRPVARWSWRELLGYLLGAGAFAIFFGGVFLTAWRQGRSAAWFTSWSRCAGSTSKTKLSTLLWPVFWRACWPRPVSE